ncbi:MAG: dienelactone hydrolase family protein [Candidatus Binatia bacterium]
METRMIDVPGAGSAFVAHPGTPGPRPAVVVVHEAFGLNAHIRDVAQRIAAEGYLALAPDLFWRGGSGRTAGYDRLPLALQMMGELTDDGVVGDVSAAIAWLAGQADVRPDRIGITGFCLGGRVSYLVACAVPERIAACVAFYGGGIPVERTPTLAAPVLAFFGDQDPFIPMDQVEQLRAAATALGKTVEVVVYRGAPHGFFCNERDSYRPDAASDAWARLTGFFARHLKV